MKRPSSGFTLIELLVAMTVAGILAAIAIPAFNNFVMNDRDANQINSLVASFNYARSEAVKLNKGTGVGVCPSSDGSTCNNPAQGYSAGWLVLDLDPAVPTPANKMQAVPALAGANVLSMTGGSANATIVFRSNGTVLLKGKIKICDIRGGAFARDVEVNPVGSITSSQKAGFDATGAALACP